LTRAGILWLAALALVLAGCADEQLKRLGDICARADECASGRCDERVCKASDPVGLGQRCGQALQCRSERCLDGQCVEGSRPPGAPCADDQQCQSGRCVALVCAGAEVDAAPPMRDAGPDAAPDAGAEHPSHLWSKRIGGPIDNQAWAIAVDHNGNVTIAGAFAGTVDFGGGRRTSAGGSDIYLASYDADGHHRWSKRFGAGGEEVAHGLAVDGAGHLYLTGSFDSSSLEMGGGPLPGSDGDATVVVARFDAQGNHRWSHSYGGPMTDEGFDITAAADGTSYITGYCQDGLDFGQGPLIHLGMTDAFVASFDADGNHRWSTGLGGNEVDFGKAVTTGDGQVYVAGHFHGTVDLGEGDVTAAGAMDVFLSAFATDGSYRWSRTFGGGSQDYGNGLAAGEGVVILAGASESLSIDYGGGPLVSKGGNDALVAVLGSDGSHRWSGRFGTLFNDALAGVRATANEMVLVGTSEGDGLDFGGGHLPHAGAFDIHLVRLTYEGGHVWSRRFGGAREDAALALALDAADNVHAVGTTASPLIDLGGGPLSSAGVDDIILFKLAP